MKRFFAVGAAFAALASAPANAGFADTAGARYQIRPDIIYAVASGQPLKLDLYLRRAAPRAAPVLVYFHGGGWVDGHKENAALLLLPYLEMGWTVVNVEYRLARVAPAPAAVEDIRCALRWVARNSAQYGFDSARIVVAGDSAGGHLAPMVALVPAGSPFDRGCATPDAVRWNSAHEPPLKVAAVVNWFGVTDIAAMLEGPEARHYAVEWFGSNPERAALAQRLSPLALVRAGVALPPGGGAARGAGGGGCAEPARHHRRRQARCLSGGRSAARQRRHPPLPARSGHRRAALNVVAYAVAR